MDHLLEVAGCHAGEVEGAGGGGDGAEHGGGDEDEEVAGAQAAAGVRHGCATGGQVRLVKDTRLEAREEASPSVRLESQDYSIPGKRK